MVGLESVSLSDHQWFTSMRSSRVLVYCLAVLLVGAVGLIVYGETRVEQPTFTGKLIDLLPTDSEIPGWRRELRPIADTPEMKQKVSEMLNYDDAVFAVFTRGQERISVYMAYWSAGKMAHRLVASHTPDVCWVRGGWRRHEVSTNASLNAEEKALLPAQQRRMSLRGMTETVFFWHVVGGRVISYGDSQPPWYSVFADLWRHGLRQRHEQFFIRISSGAADETWWSSEPVQRLAVRLPMLHAPGT